MSSKPIVLAGYTFAKANGANNIIVAAAANTKGVHISTARVDLYGTGYAGLRYGASNNILSVHGNASS